MSGRFFLPLLGLGVGLFLGLSIAFLAGEDPISVIWIIGKSAFGSRYDLGVTLYYATALTFTGLSVAMAFKSGLFNIGAEGQLVIGSLAAAAVGVFFPAVPFPLAPLLALSAAILMGGLWGWIPGWLRTKRGSHEVINTIMLNFVAAAIASWAITRHLQNPDRQSPETPPVPEAYFLRTWDPFVEWFQDSPVSMAFPFSILVAISLWLFLWRTPWGYEIRATGANEEAARVAGIDVEKSRQIAMAIAGATAGLVALNEVLGGVGKMRLGFSPDFGFIGIAVALLARNHPIGILFSAFLFGALHKGAADLDIETEYITRDISLVIQALVILCVAVATAVGLGPRSKKRNVP